MNKRVLRTLPALVLAASFGSPATADVDSRTYLVPAVSYVVADDDRLADDNAGLQLGFGKAVSDRWNMEFSLVGDILERTDNDNKYEQAGVLIDGLLFFTRNPAFAPYMVIGAGALNTAFAGDNNNTNPMANVGFGFFRQLTQGGTQLRLDARYRVDEDNRTVDGKSHERFEDVVVNLGLAIPFGAAPQPEPEPAPEPAAAAAPQPAPAPVVVDTDGDGVPDDKDACAGTAVGAKVDARGCELDSDGDGVVDSKDQCPNTAAGVKVDTKGCKIPEVVVLHGVNFASGSDRLLPESLAVLDEVAATLRKYPEMVVEVAGYTDNTGSRAFNERLSYRRAKAVRSYLITKGVAPEQLIAKGYGPANPVASNSTPEGRAKNRRVELHTLKR